MNPLTTLAAGPGFWLPRAASTTAEQVDGLFLFLVLLSCVCLGGIAVTILLFISRYRRRSPDQKTSPISGNARLELAWAAAPAGVLVLLFAWGFSNWMTLNVPPRNALEVRVVARKWSWEFDYPDQDIAGVSELVVPLGKPVKLLMSSEDVIHSFFVPAFRIKRDVIPNRYSVIWFEPTEKGTFDVLCAEYCGTGHSKMHAHVKVVDPAAFARWVESGGGSKNLSSADLGKKLFAVKGCQACHSNTTSRNKKPGPPLAGQFGKSRKLSGGATTTMDANYIRESLEKPRAKVVDGYAPIMPPFAGRLKEREINALIDYIKSLK